MKDNDVNEQDPITHANLAGKICNIVMENGRIASINTEKGLSGIDADGRSFQVLNFPAFTWRILHFPKIQSHSK